MRSLLCVALTLFGSALPLRLAAEPVVRDLCPAGAPVPARPALTGIAFAAFYVSNDDAAQRFYSAELGLRPLAAGNGATNYPVNAHQWIETLPSASPVRNSRLAAVGLTVANAADMECYLKAKGYPAIHWPESDPSASLFSNGRFAVHDPEGNVIVFVDAHTPTLQPLPHNNAISTRIIHAGFVVQSAAKEDTFYRDILGFHPYWHGGMKEGVTDWSSMQVPDGTDWIEYMLNGKPDASAAQRGVSNHVSLGVVKMDSAVAQLKANGCETKECTSPQMGRDGKVQLNLYDPDHTRVEVMEFTPTGPVCCSPYTGAMPGPDKPVAKR